MGSDRPLITFYLVPPGGGICHQVNLENIATTIWVKVKLRNENYLFILIQLWEQIVTQQWLMLFQFWGGELEELRLRLLC